MASFDIDQQEIVHIEKAVDLSGTNILEIGCGSGRLTEQLAPLCESVTGVDADEETIDTSSKSNTIENVTYLTASALDLPFENDSFDLVIFSLSLCCVDPEDRMKDAVSEAIRVLRNGGHLINLMPSTVRNFDAGWLWYYIDTENESQLYDTWVAAARLALKQSVFIDRKLAFVQEQKVRTRWSYDDIEEIRERWQDRYDTFAEDESPDHRTTFGEQLDRYLSEAPLIWTIDEEMQVLRK